MKIWDRRKERKTEGQGQMKSCSATKNSWQFMDELAGDQLQATHSAWLAICKGGKKHRDSWWWDEPVTVQFEKHSVWHALIVGFWWSWSFQDRNAVLQRANLLKGTTILISEDFPQKVVKKRELLLKYAKQVSLFQFRISCSPYFYFYYKLLQLICIHHGFPIS